MKNIGNIIAQNLVKLRKKNNLTQNDFAKKLDYSDNTVSRWERAEIIPSVETLQKISELFQVPLESLFKEDITESIAKEEKIQKLNKIYSILLSVSVIWFIATVIFIYGNLFFNTNLYMVFVWSVPISCLILLPFNDIWGKYVYKFIILSVFVWTTLLSFFFQFYQYKLWLIFIVGIPIQLAFCLWAFIKPKKREK